MHNNKGNNCNLFGHEVRKHSGSSIYMLWSYSSANNWPDPSPTPQTQLTPRSLRNLLPTLSRAFPGLQFHMQVSGQYKTTVMLAVQFKPFAPINILQTCQGVNQPPVKITMRSWYRQQAAHLVLLFNFITIYPHHLNFLSSTPSIWLNPQKSNS